MSTTLQHRILPDEQGERLDRILARAWPELTRSRIQKLLEQGSITVDGRAARASDQPHAGALVVAQIPAAAPSVLVPEDIPLDVVYEDEHVLVVNKPAGLVVHPGAGVRSGTLVHALLAHAPSVHGVGGVARPGLVHRLDKDTSGLLVVAKSDAAFRKLSEDLAKRLIDLGLWMRAMWIEFRLPMVGQHNPFRGASHRFVMLIPWCVCVLPPSALSRMKEFSPVMRTSFGSTGVVMSRSL